MLLGALYALMPIQLEQLALGDEVGLYMAWLILCGMAFQLPNGSLADRLGKRTMMGVQTLMVGGGCLLVWEFGGNSVLILAFALWARAPLPCIRPPCPMPAARCMAVPWCA
ncbi:hypothetical protein MBH78_14930 [Oceanimonas sp. NS1]|nr:hypothetical protein [Oceanimonas sp. NS1]